MKTKINLKTRSTLSAFVVCLTLTSACSTSATRGPTSVDSEANPLVSVDLRPELLQYDAKITLTETGPVKTHNHCNIKRIVLAGRDPVVPGSNSSEVVSAFIYTPKESSSTLPGKVLINPPTGGITPLDRGLAQSLCQKGAEVAVLETWSGYDEPGKIDFGSHDRASIRAIFAARYVIEYLNAPITILGSSVGAIYSSMIMGQDSRVKAGVFLVGGAPMVDVLTLTDQKIPATLREERMEQFHIADQKAYHDLLEKNVRISASDFASSSRAQDILMFVGLRDTTVPTATQIFLWKAWGQPERIDFKKNHVDTIVAASVLRKHKIMKFILAHAKTP